MSNPQYPARLTNLGDEATVRMSWRACSMQLTKSIKSRTDVVSLALYFDLPLAAPHDVPSVKWGLRQQSAGITVSFGYMRAWPCWRTPRPTRD